jgi:hypothetical protein
MRSGPRLTLAVGVAALAVLVTMIMASAGAGPDTTATRTPKVPKRAKFVGKTDQGRRITIRTSRTGRSLRTFATTAMTSLCLVQGYPSSPQVVSIRPRMRIRLSGKGRFSIDKPNRRERYDPNYRIKGRVRGNRVSGSFAWRRLKRFADESCVTREIRFRAKRKRRRRG